MSIHNIKIFFNIFIQLIFIVYSHLIAYSDIIQITTHHNHVASAAQATHIRLINNKLVTKLIITARVIIFTLSLTLQTQASILKLIWSKKLNVKNNTEYCNIIQEVRNFPQNNTYDIGIAKVNKNKLKAIEMITKLFTNNSFTREIFEVSHFPCISEKRGKRRPKIGHIIIKGIPIIDR